VGSAVQHRRKAPAIGSSTPAEPVREDANVFVAGTSAGGHAGKVGTETGSANCREFDVSAYLGTGT